MGVHEWCAGPKRTTDSRSTQRIAPNVFQRSFSTATPNRAWVSDVKRFALAKDGCTCLLMAAVTDLFSRCVVGHAMGASHDTTLALRALNNAKATCGHTRNLMHHSDRGSPNGTDIYNERLASFHMRPSMNRRAIAGTMQSQRVSSARSSGSSCDRTHSQRRARHSAP